MKRSTERILTTHVGLQKKVFGDPGRSRRRTPACDADITVRDPDAAKLVGAENVLAGSDCGYGIGHPPPGQAAVDPDVVWAKLAALTEGAAIASRQLY